MEISWAEILLSIVVFSTVIMGVAAWTGGVASVYNINDSANATYLNQIGNISAELGTAKANIDIEGDPSILDYIGAPLKMLKGAWNAFKLLFQAPDLVSSMLSSMGEEGESPIIVPQWAVTFVYVSLLVVVMMLIIQVILNRQRGII